MAPGQRPHSTLLKSPWLKANGLSSVVRIRAKMVTDQDDHDDDDDDDNDDDGDDDDRLFVSFLPNVLVSVYIKALTLGNGEMTRRWPSDQYIH